MSKGLEALEEIVNYAIGKFADSESKYRKDLEIVEKALKVLEFIIKHYEINVYWTRHNVTGYEMRLDGKDGDTIFIEITKAEYDLLKEVLEV